MAIAEKAHTLEMTYTIPWHMPRGWHDLHDQGKCKCSPRPRPALHGPWPDAVDTSGVLSRLATARSELEHVLEAFVTV